MESRAVVRIILVLLCVDLACTASVVTLAQDRASVELAERVGVFCLDTMALGSVRQQDLRRFVNKHVRTFTWNR